MNPITPYLFGETTIRSLTIDAEPWFVANDVCTVLSIANPRDATRSLDEDEKGVAITDTLGGPQETVIVNESGLYALIFKSRKSEARRFRKWVTSEVLPAIRRTGSYGRSHTVFLSLIKDQISLGVSPDLAARLAGKLTGEPAEQIPTREMPTSRQDQEISFILSLLKPGVSYTVPEISDLIPAGHCYRQDSLASRNSRIGKILNRATHHQRLEKLYGRHNRYRLPTITSFPASNG